MVFIPYTNLDGLLQMWQQAGIFSVLIPFVLVFAVVFAILNKSKILGTNTAIQAVIAIALGFGALQFDWTTRLFYAEFFKNFAVGIIVLLVLFIFVGLVAGEGDKKPWNILFAVAGFLVFLVVLVKSYGNISWTSSNFWGMYGGYLVLGIIIIGIILLVTLSSRGQKSA